jgi:acyl-CoA synthetase (AMP-forming)/AMP-acid ligase II
MILASQESMEKYTRLGVWSEKTLIDYLKEHVEKTPDQVCVVDPINKKDLMGLEPERLTYKAFATAVDATAQGLAALGIGKDDVVMVQLPNCWELAMIYLAVAKTGGITSPAPMLWREAELGYIAGLTEAKLVITVDSFNGFKHLEMAQKLQAQHPGIKNILTLEQLRKMSREPVTGAFDDVKIDANDIFTICWTSGTEANSKGCPLSHNNWIGMAVVQNAAGMQPGDVMITAGPLVNMASVGTVYIPWIVLGGTMVLHHPFNPQVFMQQIMTERPNYTLLVPAVTNMIAKHPDVDKFDLSCFRSITIGSAPPSLYTMEVFKQKWDIDIGNIWGQNEGTGIISGLEDVPDMKVRVDHFPQYGRPGNVWKSRASRIIDAKVVDAVGTELSEAGEVGELVYKGPGVIAGYFKNPEQTKKAFTEDGYFRTGDLFQIREGGHISFFERGKDIIIRGGYNISSQEIENYLLGCPKIQEVAVVGMPDDKLGERMCAYVTPVPGESVTLEDLCDHLASVGVAKYKYPERIEIIEAIPRNPVGKILKKNLRADLQTKL